MYRVWDFVTAYSLLMVAGAVIALAWANINPGAHHALVEWTLLAGSPVGAPTYGPDGAVVTRTLTLHYLVNDVLMALFFAIAAKEVWEAVALRNGSLRGRRALVPVMSALGGMAGPALVYLGLVALMGSTAWDALAHGWAVPTATDIAFSYIVARIVFGAGHPAVGFLLMLAIVDDALGLVIIAAFYPKGAIAPEWLLLSAGAAVGAYLLFNLLPRRLDRGRESRPVSGWVRRRLSAWPYAVAGAASWYGFQQAGLHPALGLLPIIPAIPHAETDFGIYADAEGALGDLLNAIEHALRLPVEAVLFLFGLLNAGVVLTAAGPATWAVLAGLLIGKPLGIALAGAVGARLLGLPRGMGRRDLLVVGVIAGTGFTVALFVATVAFDPGLTMDGRPVQDAAKLGALLSVLAGPLAWVAARALGAGGAGAR